jgi:hypothetical protein
MNTKGAMFESTAIRDTRAIAWVKRACAIVVSAYLVIGMIATYRALVQVRRLDVQSPEVLQAGSEVSATVVSYARVPLEMRIELVQGEHYEIIAAQRVPKNEWSLLDPRTQTASQSAVLTADILGRFTEGKAIVRATVDRRQQLGRHPPPVVQEQVVNIQRRGSITGRPHETSRER